MRVLTKEPQYSLLIDSLEDHGQEKLGLMINQIWYDDPKHMAFTLGRYKFVAKMLSGSKNVLEIGCGDGFASRIVLQEVENLTLIDFDSVFIDDIKKRMLPKWRFKDCFAHDVSKDGPIPGTFDGIYALDVLEHINPRDEKKFLTNLIASLVQDGSLIIGMPSLESQVYASPISKAGHVNCQSMPTLKATMQQFFHNVYMFSMNDEVLHTGYHKMAHYLFALCCNKRK